MQRAKTPATIAAANSQRLRAGEFCITRPSSALTNKDCVCIRPQCPLPQGTPDGSERETEVAGQFLPQLQASFIERLADCEAGLLNRLSRVRRPKDGLPCPSYVETHDSLGSARTAFAEDYKTRCHLDSYARVPTIRRRGQRRIVG